MKDREKTISERALKMLENTGWCQGVSCDADGRRCVTNAIMSASPSEIPYAGSAMVNDIQCVIAGESQYLSWWNDLPNTTFDDVREALLIGASMELSNGA